MDSHRASRLGPVKRFATEMMFDQPILAAQPALAQPAVAEPEIAEPTTDPRVDDGDTAGNGSDYRVLLYNDDFHSMDEVVDQLVKATRCSSAKAEAITMEAHFKGRAVCFRGERPKCQDVCRVLREIRLQCEVDCD